MRTRRTHQPLTYDVRLPDEAQADALRLLDASREVVNGALALLWPHLDDFQADRVGPAWKQVGKYMGSPQYHGDRQWRCESEVIGRVLRAQAARKQAFEQVLPMLTDGFIRPKTEQRPAGKQRAAIKEALSTLQHNLEEEETSFVALQNVVEQCCNFFFAHDRFPWTYEELQPVPLLKVGMLTYAGDDGREKGQAYRLALDLDGGVARFRFRYPDEAGVWSWRKVDTIIPLPEAVCERLKEGELMAPTLREEHRADGSRMAVLDFIVEVEKADLPAWESVERVLRREMDRCWRKYEQRNRSMAHVASNVLVLLSRVHDCSLLSMESLKTLKSTGRGKGVRGRWRNYRNNSTIRGEIWRLLRYKCHLIGLRFHTEQPRSTSHLPALWSSSQNVSRAL